MRRPYLSGPLFGLSGRQLFGAASLSVCMAILGRWGWGPSLVFFVGAVAVDQGLTLWMRHLDRRG